MVGSTHHAQTIHNPWIPAHAIKLVSHILRQCRPPHAPFTMTELKGLHIGTWPDERHAGGKSGCLGAPRRPRPQPSQKPPETPLLLRRDDTAAGAAGDAVGRHVPRLGTRMMRRSPSCHCGASASEQLPR